ncbi:hypothetical protein BDK51DRAFT_30986 [Blyttiomyces helicus]|uniref:Uncharacterized protein n=1 Tax=Blyttiomyces helicus TaxID=388810 RepID=A0A4P9WKQ8_9FUNG|nr:hypothetical protein BDK51DRAFT_30986 [Blyttiomyces helicus]|eukprot:RKO92715.1 hypothetical protein BDK51DRAFT_30986 [Blyttiomyces helicus]
MPALWVMTRIGVRDRHGLRGGGDRGRYRLLGDYLRGYCLLIHTVTPTPFGWRRKIYLAARQLELTDPASAHSSSTTSGTETTATAKAAPRHQAAFGIATAYGREAGGKVLCLQRWKSPKCHQDRQNGNTRWSFCERARLKASGKNGPAHLPHLPHLPCSMDAVVEIEKNQPYKRVSTWIWALNLFCQRGTELKSTNLLHIIEKSIWDGHCHPMSWCPGPSSAEE